MKNEYLELLKTELVPATGCTEPIAIAYGASVLKNKYGIELNSIKKIKLKLSLNIFKNAMGVGIPGTKLTGIPIAFSLGFIAGNHEEKLNLLSNMSNENIKKAEDFLLKNKINIEIAKVKEKLYIEIEIKTLKGDYTVVINKSHTNISLLKSNNIIDFIKNDEIEEIETLKKEVKLNINEIFNFINFVDINKISFLNDIVSLNEKIALEGINNKYGLEVGRTLKGLELNINDMNIKSSIVWMTAAAADARMGGSILPVMTNSGSGNQGITATVPIIIFSKYYKIDSTLMLRALALSSLITIYLKQKLGKLSSLCGVIISAIGASCGMVYLKGGKIKNINFAIKNMIGNVSGMICDGAKNSCALKVSSVTDAAYNAMLLAMSDKFVTPLEGIVEEDIERTINNLIKIGTKGMEETDKVILDIMLSKKNL
ncbi:MAG: serine dehydratase subunit alpha family protein [Fusobacteriaceae bacterium]|nr:serine dehydratase subunit alpha family protein [Fusobacteriaceae bacterium]